MTEAVPTLAVAVYFVLLVAVVLTILRGQRRFDPATIGLPREGELSRGEWNGVPVHVMWDALGAVVSAPAPDDVRIGRGGLVMPDDVKTGDPHFDGAAYVRGPRERLLAVLDASTRVRVLELVAAGRGSVSEGTVQLRVGYVDEGGLRLALETVTAISRALAAPSAERLADTARRDVQPRVRRNAAALLARDHPDVARAVAVELAADADPGVRAEAAILSRRPPVAEELDAAMAGDPDGFPARLSTLGEDVLLAAPMGLAVARALARVGTARAVQPLLAAGFEAEARTIQARLGADAGRLAVAEGEAGSVAIVRDAGAVELLATPDRICPPSGRPSG
ncbi:MAG: hypothetical protein ACOZNI_06030 [Myxococcota bacterium]